MLRKRIQTGTLLLTVLSLVAVSASVVDAGTVTSPFDLGGAKPYTIIQLGNNGGDSTSSGSPSGGDKLEITSNSSVFGSTLKGVDDKSEKNKISTSKVTGGWDRETGVDNDLSSSATGSKTTLTTSAFNSIAADAVAASVFWAGQSGTGLTVNLDSGATQTITATGAGANVFNSTGGFIINSGSKLTLTGGPGDFFVFNISEDHLFSIQSNSIIELGGDIEASEVLFNVLGNIGSAEDDGALIGGGSIFQGTLLAPGRKVEITQNQFYTFVSGGLADDEGGTEAPLTTPITAAEAIFEKEMNDSSSGGLFGQVIAGGAINFTQSDIAHHPFMTMPILLETPIIPEPSTLVLCVGALAIVAGARRKRERAKKRA